MNFSVKKAVMSLTLLALFLTPLSVAQDADALNVWMETLYARVKGESVTPPVAARVFAYAGLTMNEDARGVRRNILARGS